MTQFTKQAITKAFVELLNEKPFDKITVTDVVNRCGVNRNTFYYYYQDVYALVDEMFRTETSKIIDAHKDYDSWQDGFLDAIIFARENKQAIYHVYNSINRERLEVYLYDVSHGTMIDFIRNQAKGLRVRDEDIDYLATFYTVALEGLVLEWLHDGMKRDPENYLENLGRILDGSIRSALEHAAETNPAL